jgi:hypothetical protein
MARGLIGIHHQNNTMTIIPEAQDHCCYVRYELILNPLTSAQWRPGMEILPTKASW